MPHEIAFVIADLGCGGAQRVVSTLASTWAERGRRVCVITFSAPDSDFFQLDPRVTRLTIAREGRLNGPLFANLRRLRQLRRALQQADPQVVVPFVTSTNILTIIAATGLDTQVVISERNDPKRQSHGHAWDWLRRRLYRYADLVTANSPGALTTMKAFVPSSKLVFAPNPIQSATTPARREEDALHFLIVGRLNRQKAHDILLRAFAQMKDASPAWRLSVVGDGELKIPLREQAEDLGIADRVDWHGRARDPFAFYAKANCFVLPSRFEGTPNALLEAMSCGLPAIVSDASSGPLEYIRDGITGLVVPVEDIDALAAAMSRMAANAELRHRLGAAAADRMSTHDPNQIIETWETFLQLLPNRTGACTS
jgi:GalNAc-alpha-(1->4)-GalNAc-alpha-(1->3)-diNAcBac-PP-undecaprenol alpha-1,4-N-acetyl-D-galactosaminyltransferase